MKEATPQGGSINRLSLTYPTLPKRGGYKVVNYWPCLLCGFPCLVDSAGIQICNSQQCFLRRLTHERSADIVQFCGREEWMRLGRIEKERKQKEVKKRCKVYGNGMVVKKEGLTSIDIEILRGLSKNRLLKQIGADLGMTRAAAAHRAWTIYQKLGVGGKFSAVEEAYRRGILERVQ